MSDATELVAIKSQLIARLKEATASPKASYKSATGQQVDWNGYLRELRQQLASINALLVAEDPMYAETQLVTPDDPIY